MDLILEDLTGMKLSRNFSMDLMKIISTPRGIEKEIYGELDFKRDELNSSGGLEKVPNNSKTDHYEIKDLRSLKSN